MRLQNRTIVILIVFIVISLAGLVMLQYILLANAMDAKLQAFRNNVNAAMNAIAQKLETAEAVRNVYRVAVKEPKQKLNMQMFSIHDDSIVTLSVTNDSGATGNTVFVSNELDPVGEMRVAPPVVRWEGDKMWYRLPTPQHVLIRVYNEATGKDSVILNSFRPAGEHSIEVANSAFSHGKFIFKFYSDSSSYTMEMRNGNAEKITADEASSKRRKELVGQVMDKLLFGERIPIEKRLSSIMLDSIIGSNLRSSGIDLPFAYGVLSEQDDSLHILQPAVYQHELQTSQFKTRLFPNDISFSFNQLVVYFPGLQAFLLKQVLPHLLLTVVFMSIIVYCFTYTIRTILRQKQFSLRLMDFVNNMTHEFKTPISTISVAAETMIHPAVIGDEEKLRRYGAVIRDENFRMKQQVDKILQMAVLEEGNYTLKCVPVDVHEVISKVLENNALRIEQNQGSVNCTLEAEHAVINADTVHLTNIISNVLDNAIKYSQELLEIKVRTRNFNDSILIMVKDHGIGIAEENRHRVFEKYYRAHTGNVHNVKGFGLGLSYVKLMTEAHGGEITLESTLGLGTTVEMRFPLMKSGEST